MLGVSGGIAAYKAVYLARRLIESGAEVQAVMTSGALHFVGEQSLSAVTGRPAVTSLYGGASVSPHTEMAAWADAMVVAPATANVMAKVAAGLADDALCATVAAFDGPVVLAPAMHTEMWDQPATRRNARRLEEDGAPFGGPRIRTVGRRRCRDRAHGRAGGDSPGRGRGCSTFPSRASRCWSRRAAPGRPSIRSATWATAPRARWGTRSRWRRPRRGARVVLVTAAPAVGMPVAVEVVEVESAEDMAREVWARSSAIDAAVLAAAVADFRPAGPADSKLARVDGPPRIVLEPTPNVLAGLVERVPNGATVVGFAAETGGLDRAVHKAASYGVDFIAANDVTLPGSGFGVDTNEVSIIFPDGRRESFGLMTKREVAEAVMSKIADLRAAVV